MDDILYTENQKSNKIFNTEGLNNDEVFPLSSAPDMEELAKIYIKRGFFVTPLGFWKHDKAKCAFTNGFQVPGLLPNTSDHWNAEKQNRNSVLGYNIGIVNHGGWVGLDVDRKNGKDALKGLIRLLGHTESLDGLDLKALVTIFFRQIGGPTFTAITPSGGLHFYFETDTEFTNTNGQIAEGLDIKSEGGLLVAPGSSLFKNNERVYYKVLVPAKMAKLPTSLQDILDNHERKLADAQKARMASLDSIDRSKFLPLATCVDRARKYVAKVPGAISGQGGRKITANVAKKLVCDFALPEDQAMEILQKYNEKCEPRWSQKELNEKLKWGFDHIDGRFGSKVTDEKLDLVKSEFDLEGDEAQNPSSSNDIILSQVDDKRISDSFMMSYDDDELIFDNEGYYKYNGEIYRLHSQAMIYDLMSNHLDRCYVQVKEGKKKLSVNHGAIETVLKYQFNKLKGRGESTTEDMARNSVFIQHLGKGVAFKDGYVKYNDGLFELVPHSPKHRAIYRVNGNYDPNSACPMFDKFLWDMFEDAEIIESVEEAIAVTINGQGPKYKKAFFVQGESNSGKSQLGQIISALLPSYLQTTIGLESLEDKHERVKLHGSLANFAFETSEVEIHDSKWFKALVAGDKVSARDLYQSSFSFVPFCTFWFFPNSLPKIHDTTDAVLNRMNIYRARNVFDQNPVGTQKKAILKIADQIIAKELPAIAVKIMKAFVRIEQRGGFKALKVMQDDVNEHRAGTNNVNGFFRECIEARPGGSVSLYKAYDEYMAYCIFNRIPENRRKDRKAFGMMFATEYKRMLKQNTAPIRNGNDKIYEGVRIISNPHFVGLRSND
jgi:P4 family phage/plasmid primase-like protien